MLTPWLFDLAYYGFFGVVSTNILARQFKIVMGFTLSV